MEPLNPKDPKSIGGFTLIGRLGKGGMGIVYLASHKSQSVALKVIRDSLIDDEIEAARFSREVSTLQQITSPHVAGIIDTGVDDGRAWFATEFVNGPNLRELVKDKGPLPDEQWWKLARGLLIGLADIHEAGVIHRDIKPANLLMAESGPKLIDFGIANVSDATSVTATGLVVGSPSWFSPEQIEGFPLTPATDVFSAGSLLTFAASGASPWGDETTLTKASIFKILSTEPNLHAMSPEQRILVERMLEKEALHRPSAQELLENLRLIQDGQKPEIGNVSKALAKQARATNRSTTRTRPVRSVKAVTKQKKASKSDKPTEPGSITSSKKKTGVAVVSILVAAVSGISFLVANSSSSGKVSVAVDVVQDNPAIGDFSMRISSGSIEPVVLELSDGGVYNSVFTWQSGEPIRIAYEPPFSEDEAFVGTLMPSELGLNAVTNGQPLYIQVSLEEASTLLSFRAGANQATSETYAVRLARGNEKEQLAAERAALEACVRTQSDVIQGETFAYRQLREAYWASKERAGLVTSESLLYTQWAARAGTLLTYLDENLAQAESSRRLSPVSQEYVKGIVGAHSEVRRAWVNLRSVARRESHAEWDSAWTKVFSSEKRLTSNTWRPTRVIAQSFCLQSLE